MRPQEQRRGEAPGACRFAALASALRLWLLFLRLPSWLSVPERAGDATMEEPASWIHRLGRDRAPAGARDGRWYRSAVTSGHARTLRPPPAPDRQPPLRSASRPGAQSP